MGNAKLLRQKFKFKKNMLTKMRRCDPEYAALQKEVDQLAKDSDELSFKKGVPFTDSKGNRQCEPTDQTEESIVALAVHIYKDEAKSRSTIACKKEAPASSRSKNEASASSRSAIACKIEIAPAPPQRSQSTMVSAPSRGTKREKVSVPPRRRKR